MMISTMKIEEIVVVDSGEVWFYTTVSDLPDVQVKKITTRTF